MCLRLRCPYLLRVGLEGWKTPSPSPSHGGRGSDWFARTSAVFCVGLPLPKHRRIGTDAFVLIKCFDGFVVIGGQGEIPGGKVFCQPGRAAGAGDGA